jgi:hypothetical protein
MMDTMQNCADIPALGCSNAGTKKLARDFIPNCNCQQYYNELYYDHWNCLQYGLGTGKEAECAGEVQEALCFECPEVCAHVPFVDRYVLIIG